MWHPANTGGAQKPRVHTTVVALIALLVATLAAGPAEAKALRLNIEADPATLSPIQNCELISGDIIDNMYEGLTAIDKDGRVVPAQST